MCTILSRRNEHTHIIICNLFNVAGANEMAWEKECAVGANQRKTVRLRERSIDWSSFKWNVNELARLLACLRSWARAHIVPIKRCVCFHFFVESIKDANLRSKHNSNDVKWKYVDHRKNCSKNSDFLLSSEKFDYQIR